MDIINALLVEHFSDTITAAVLVIITASLGWLLIFFLDRVVFRLARRTNTTLDDVILKTLRRPVFEFSLLIGLQLALKHLQFLPVVWLVLANDLLFISFLLLGYLLLYRLIRDILAWYAKNIAARTATTLDDQFIPFFRRLILVIFTAIFLIMALQHFGYDITAFVATLGVGSLAVALAAQSTLSDAINGLIIMIDRSFRLGDRIEIQDLDTWGDVLDIGLRSTRIRTRDNRMVIVPNSVIGKSLIVNHSYPNSQYRVQTEVGIAYGCDIEKARQTMIEAVRSQDWVMKDKRIEALFLAFGDSALTFRVRCWIESYVETRRVVDKLNSCLYDALNQAGIEMPFPQRTLWHRLEPEAEQTLKTLFQD